MAEHENVTPKKKRAKYELVIIVFVVIVALLVAFGIYRRNNEAVKGQLLISELTQLRSAITTYKTLNKTNPPSLESLFDAKYSFTPGEAPKPYLSDLPLNKKGEIVDPFGNPYTYNKQKAWVASATPGYKDW